MEKSEKHYQQLNAEERATIMLMRQEKRGLREIGCFLKRSPGTILRETGRDLASESGLRCIIDWRTRTEFCESSPVRH